MRELVSEVARAIVFRYQTLEVRRSIARGITHSLRAVDVSKVFQLDSYNMVLIMVNGDEILL